LSAPIQPDADIPVFSLGPAIFRSQPLEGPSLFDQSAVNVVKEVEEFELAVECKLAAVRLGTVEGNAKRTIGWTLQPNRFTAPHEQPCPAHDPASSNPASIGLCTELRSGAH